MCCFSHEVEKVADTNIFARPAKQERQFLVYSMLLASKSDVAMILPLPVPKDSKEDAVKFINLEKYENFFADMKNGFPAPLTRGPANGGLKDEAKKDEAPKLAVVQVGGFEASFVPAVKDFARLDERFRLPADVWDKLPAYKDFGFAVFKLKEGEKKIHPMAFEFPRANPDELFFPTVHIHDGKVHEKADFDHALYCQKQRVTQRLPGWDESAWPAADFMKVAKAEGLVDGAAHVYRLKMHGSHKNADVLV